MCLFARGTDCRSPYKAHPKLVVVIVTDPLRGDYAEDGTENGRKFLNRPEGCWYVMAVPMPHALGSTSGTDHASPNSDDTHAPQAFYGLVFHSGTYPGHAKPVGLSVTLASLLGVHAPRNMTDRVPTKPVATSEAPLGSQEDQRPGSSYVQPASRNLAQGDD